MEYFLVMISWVWVPQRGFTFRMVSKRFPLHHLNICVFAWFIALLILVIDYLLLFNFNSALFVINTYSPPFRCDWSLLFYFQLVSDSGFTSWRIKSLSVILDSFLQCLKLLTLCLIVMDLIMVIGSLVWDFLKIHRHLVCHQIWMESSS